MRQNGCQPPFSWAQVSTWILLILMVGTFYGLVIPPLHQFELKITVALLFGIFAGIAVMSAFIVSSIDPCDDQIQGITSSVNTERGGNIYCHFCSAHVKRSSKHCTYCNKCVEEYDHHCIWLNNCVGKKNYRQFFVSIVFTCAFTCLELAMLVYNVIQYFNDIGLYEKDIHDTYGPNVHPLALFVLNWVFIILLVPVAFLIGQLVCLHTHLCREGITTYEYIIREDQRMNLKNKRRNGAKVGHEEENL